MLGTVAYRRQDIEAFPNYIVYQDRRNSIISTAIDDNLNDQKYTNQMSTYAIDYWKKISGSSSQMYISVALLVISTILI